jgi:hypothetical protein
MSLLERLRSSAIVETYALNLAQILHMVILAGFVPWHIGLDGYGRFAALVTLPGLLQSSFEVICVTMLSEHRRRDMLRNAILRFALPLYLAIVAGFFYLLDPRLAVAASLMGVLLLARSYAFSIAIVSGVMTKRILQSEAIIFIVYAIVAIYCVLNEVRSEYMPLVMVSLASLATACFLLFTSRWPVVVLPEGQGVTIPRLPLAKFAHTASLRFFEDGYLTLTPLILASVLGAAVAGQFRIFVSIAKAGYKFFPFRYEVVLRDLNIGTLSFQNLATGCIVFVGIGTAATAALHFSGLWSEYKQLFILFGASGVVVALLALFPAASSKDGRILPLAAVGLAATFGTGFVYGFAGFSIAFAISSLLLLIVSLLSVRRAATATK